MRSPRAWPRLPSLPILAVAATVRLAGDPAAAQLVINEILPDPAGSDAGHEFIEFLNIGQEPFAMEGVEFQFANGAEGPVWRTRWTGDTATVVPPGARFLVVDRNWPGPPAGDAVATLGLQNGPDAVRLIRGEVVLDLVGYGPLTDPALAEGTPAPVAPGRSLSRRPDGQDSDDNSRDFVAADPTPGGVNFRPWSLAVDAWALEPPSLARAGAAVSVQVTLRNDGLAAWPPTALQVLAGGDRAESLLGAWPAGATRSVTWILRPASEGGVPVRLAAWPPGAPAEIAIDLGRVQVGPGPLVLNEVLAAPGQGQGEWFEVLAAGAGPVELADYEVRDEGGAWRRLPDRILAPGDLAVVAQDSAALADWIVGVAEHGGRPDCPADPNRGVLAGLPGWPSLNNTRSADHDFADRLWLRDALGTTIDHAVLGAANGPDTPGRSLERSSVRPVHPTGAPWAVCTAGAGSTPLCANSTTLTADRPGVSLALVPAVLDAAGGGGAVHAVFVLPAPAVRWRLRMFDLWGVLVRDFGGDDLGPGPRDLLWDGRDDAGMPVPAGAYVFALEVWAAEPGAFRRELRLCVVRR